MQNNTGILHHLSFFNRENMLLLQSQKVSTAIIIEVSGLIYFLNAKKCATVLLWSDVVLYSNLYVQEKHVEKLHGNQEFVKTCT